MEKPACPVGELIKSPKSIEFPVDIMVIYSITLIPGFPPENSPRVGDEQDANSVLALNKSPKFCVFQVVAMVINSITFPDVLPPPKIPLVELEQALK